MPPTRVRHTELAPTALLIGALLALRRDAYQRWRQTDFVHTRKTRFERVTILVLAAENFDTSTVRTYMYHTWYASTIRVPGTSTTINTAFMGACNHCTQQGGRPALYGIPQQKQTHSWIGLLLPIVLSAPCMSLNNALSDRCLLPVVPPSPFGLSIVCQEEDTRSTAGGRYASLSTAPFSLALRLNYERQH